MLKGFHTVQLLQDSTSMLSHTKQVYSTISGTGRRFQETGSYSRRTGQGCRRSLTHQQDRYLLLRQATGVNVSTQTIRNRLHEVVWGHCRLWEALCSHQNWQVRCWCPVLLTAGSRSTLSTCDRHGSLEKMRRPLCCLQHRSVWRSGEAQTSTGYQVAVWLPLHYISRYQDESLKPIVRPYAGAAGPGFLLIQDNAWPDVAGRGMDAEPGGWRT